MNRLINKKIFHKELGNGIITHAEDTDKGIFITVEFPITKVTKRFGFPIALGKALSSEDEELLTIAKEITKAKEEEKKVAEEKQKAEEEKKLIIQSENAVKNAEKIISSIDWNIAFNKNNCKIFKVHQGKTFTEEYKGKYVWAPASGIHHHEKMKEIHTGDIIFHYADGALVAIGEAVSDCMSYPQPTALYGHGWGHLGYRVNVRYQLLTAPFSLAPLKKDIINHKAGSYSSFDSNGDACQGYMYELEYDLAKLFKAGILSTAQSPGVVNALGRIK